MFELAWGCSFRTCLWASVAAHRDPTHRHNPGSARLYMPSLTSRAISAVSYGGVSAVSHPFNHNSLDLDTAPTPKRISGIAPLTDVSRAWRKQPEAQNECWPATNRDYIGGEIHHELNQWSHRSGHFYHHVKSDAPESELASTRRPPTAPATPPPPAYHSALITPTSSRKTWGWQHPLDHPWQHGPPHVMLSIRPPRPPGSSHGFGMGPEHASMAASFASTSGSGCVRERPHERHLSATPRHIDLCSLSMNVYECALRMLWALLWALVLCH